MRAARSGRAGGIRRAHIGREFSNDVADGHFILDHLIVTLLLGYLVQILVRPCVTGDLMAFGDHTADNSRPWRGFVINGALSNIDTRDKEGGLHAICGKLIEDIVGVDVWAVVVGNGDGSWLNAIINTLPTIWYGSELGSRNFAGASSRRQFVGITSWSILELTIGGKAEFITLSTPSLHRISNGILQTKSILTYS